MKNFKKIGLNGDKKDGNIHFPNNEKELFKPKPKENVKTILIYFVGGITYAEIAAIRLIQKSNPGLKLKIATTSIINGDKAVK